MFIELKNGQKVEIKDALTWGDVQKVQASLAKGAKVGGMKSEGETMNMDFDTSAMFESRYVLLQIAVKNISEGETTIKYSREWMDELSIEDGNTVFEAVDNLQKKDGGTVQN